jgi:hypothetical protein
MWGMTGCAPLVMTGPLLERAKQTLARAGSEVTFMPRMSRTR